MMAKGAVAAGHPETAQAAAQVLDGGGNAFDAALAGLCAACVAEPVLASLGGGGFFLARPGGANGGAPTLYDFFVQTPKNRRPPGEIDFFPIVADFGAAQQTFHIGRGAMATPGAVRGIFEVHRDLGHMPLEYIFEPACALARNGFSVNALQAYIFRVVQAIYMSGPECRAYFASGRNPDQPVGEGEMFSMPVFADALEALAREGADLFYKGEMGQAVVDACRHGGGMMTAEDLQEYQVVKRAPLEFDYAHARVHTNPPPSTGGILIAFALDLLARAGPGDLEFGGQAHLERLVHVMELTNKARLESGLHAAGDDGAKTLLNPEFLEAYRAQVLGRPSASRGTTHISVVDAKGNAAAVTLSNGEGSGYLIPGAGIMMNNMLGEEDINPGGFHRWQADVRMASMMAPTLVEMPGGRLAVLGSGGSNRIRTAILQVVANMLDFAMTPEEAISAPRVHFEGGQLNIENGFGGKDMEALAQAYPGAKVWDDRNLYFGGVHCVLFDEKSGTFDGAGDSRRGGVALTV